MKTLISASLSILYLLTMANSVARAAGEDDPLWKKPTYEKKVSAIGRKLLDANNIEELIAFRIQHNRKKVNASANGDFAVVQIATGLLNYIESDDELAAILGHEIAHVILRHQRKVEVRHALGTLFITTPLAVAGILAGPIGAAAGVSLGEGITNSLTRGSSRKVESQADRMGLVLMAEAGYEPRAFESISLKLFSDGTHKETWRSHPMGGKRVKAIKALIMEYEIAKAEWDEEQNNLAQQSPSLSPSETPMLSAEEEEAIQAIAIEFPASETKAIEQESSTITTPQNSDIQPDSVIKLEEFDSSPLDTQPQ